MTTIATDVVGTPTTSLNTNWLDGTSTTIYGNTLAYWPYTYSYTRVRLQLSEVEVLRKAAKKDKAVREILRKFTNHIELVVDFD